MPIRKGRKGLIKGTPSVCPVGDQMTLDEAVIEITKAFVLNMTIEHRDP